jgi:hypothetical protein
VGFEGEELLVWYGFRLMIASASLRRRVWLHLRLVSYFVTLMVLLRSGVLLETRSCVSLRLMVCISLLLLGFCSWFVCSEFCCFLKMDKIHTESIVFVAVAIH